MPPVALADYLDLQSLYENTLLPTLEWIAQLAQRISSGESDASRSSSPSPSEGESLVPVKSDHHRAPFDPSAEDTFPADTLSLSESLSDGMPDDLMGGTRHQNRSRGEELDLEERYRQLQRKLHETEGLLKARDEELHRLRRGSFEDHRGDRRYSHDSGRSGGRHTPHSDSSVYRAHRRHSSNASSNTTPSVVSATSGRSLSDEGRARLSNSETFLTRTDHWSGAQVIQAVKDLNSEILQFAASVTEVARFEQRSSELATSPCQDTIARIGPRLMNVLSSRDHSQDSVLVQLALQGCLSIFASRALGLFCIGFDSASNAVLTGIYAGLAESGE